MKGQITVESQKYNFFRNLLFCCDYIYMRVHSPPISFLCHHYTRLNMHSHTLLQESLECLLGQVSLPKDKDR